MKLFKIIIFIFLAFLISGCTPKLTVKSLYPSQIPNEKFHSVYVEEFLNDNINQSLKIEEKIVNKIIDNQRVFKLTNKRNSDVILTGEVIDSSLYYNIFYKRDIDYSRCKYYRYDEKTKKKNCLEYYVKVTPCENREYKVKTKIRLLDSSNKAILFSKVYEKSKDIQKCYDYHYYPYHSFNRDKKGINSMLASYIADDVLDDISPHYVYFDLEIIDELDETIINYTKEQKEKFKKIVKIMENRSLITAREELRKLKSELNEQSWEITYNLALTYEGLHNLYEANKLYQEAKQKISQIDDLELVNKAIIRTQKNLEEKIKAKSQLP